MARGKFIAIYGINGIGKSTQAHKIVEVLKKKNIDVQYLKYPVYTLPPEGPFLHNYLRDAKFRAAHPQTTHELQAQFMRNRERHEKAIQTDLENGTWIVAEDYIGTGIAWGMTWGGDFDYLCKINQHLLRPDLEILLDGEQFDTAIEKGHRNEDDGEKIQICRDHLLDLSKKNSWPVVNANQTIDKVTQDLMHEIDTLR